MKITKQQQGFTLIELLMVLAIMSLLMSVVLAALTSARGKGGDAAVKSNLVNIRSQAALYFSDYGDYAVESDVCTAGIFSTDLRISAAIAAAQKSGGGAAICSSSDGAVTSGGTAKSWAIAVPLKTAPTPGYWCVDSLGASKQTTVLVPASLTSTASSTCP